MRSLALAVTSPATRITTAAKLPSASKARSRSAALRDWTIPRPRKVIDRSTASSSNGARRGARPAIKADELPVLDPAHDRKHDEHKRGDQRRPARLHVVPRPGPTPRCWALPTR